MCVVRTEYIGQTTGRGLDWVAPADAAHLQDCPSEGEFVIPISAVARKSSRQSVVKELNIADRRHA